MVVLTLNPNTWEAEKAWSRETEREREEERGRERGRKRKSGGGGTHL